MKKKKIKGYLIGQNISKSYSPELYDSVFDIDYQVKNFQKESDLETFVNKKEYLFLNVTAPYKRTIIPFLNFKSKLVEETGVCNLVVNKNGCLKGYNTDVYGFQRMLEVNKIDPKNKTILILGNGATSTTAKYVLEKMGAKQIYIGCRHKKSETDLLFNEVPKEEIQIIVNTTPCGSGLRDRRLVHLSNFKKVETFIDVIYSSFKTPTMIEAKDLGKGAINGIDMLVYQAAQAVGLITKKMLPTFIWKNIKSKIVLNHTNLVLVGLPTAGKTKMGKELKKMLNNDSGSSYFDTDEIIEKATKMTINQIFKKYGEEHFREVEREITQVVAKGEGKVISTGGGLILDSSNYRNLSKHGYIIYLKKTNFDDYVDNGKRPLIKNKEDLQKLYKERNPIYEQRADLTVSSDISANDLIQEACDAIVNN